MLQGFMSTLVVAVFIVFVVFVLNVLLLEWRFTEGVYAAIGIYSVIRKIVANEFSEPLPVEISCGNYSINFGSVEEAIFEYEKLTKRVFKYYNRLGWISKVDYSYQIDRDKLMKICSDLEESKLKRQEYERNKS